MRARRLALPIFAPDPACARPPCPSDTPSTARLRSRLAPASLSLPHGRMQNLKDKYQIRPQLQVSDRPPPVTLPPIPCPPAPAPLPHPPTSFRIPNQGKDNTGNVYPYPHRPDTASPSRAAAPAPARKLLPYPPTHPPHLSRPPVQPPVRPSMFLTCLPFSPTPPFLHETTALPPSVRPSTSPSSP